MLTELEKEEIINAAMERTLLRIPEVIGNLLSNHAALIKINKKFYDSNPEFKPFREIVASTVEAVEGENTLDDYEDVLKKSIPEIKKKISLVKKLNFDPVDTSKLTGAI